MPGMFRFRPLDDDAISGLASAFTQSDVRAQRDIPACGSAW